MSAPGGPQQSSAKKRRLEALEKSLASAASASAAKPAQPAATPSQQAAAGKKRPHDGSKPAQPAAQRRQQQQRQPLGRQQQQQPPNQARAQAASSAPASAAATPAQGGSASQGDVQGRQAPPDALYSKLPEGVISSQLGRQLQLVPAKEQQGSVDDLLEGLLRRNMGQNAARGALGSRLHGKLVMLDNPVAALTNKALASRPAHKFAGRLFSRTKRQEVTQLARGSISYESLQPLHQLWAAYISRLVEGQPSDLAARLLGADYHGCLMSVERSPNPAWAGVAGIVAKATASTFQLVSQGNRLHVVAKKGGIFQLQLPSGTRVTLQGSGLLTATRRNAQDAVSIG